MEETNGKESVVEEDWDIDEYNIRLGGGTRFSRLVEKGI